MKAEKNRLRIDLIAAARPNFMKVAPLYHALCREPWCRLRLVHTGQHYDYNMSEAFFRDLELPLPDLHLGVGSGTHSQQTARTMLAYEAVCKIERPDLIIVVGDVNSTLACALVGAKSGIRIAHLEAGLRSYDRSMPEEINRLLTDSMADILWTPSEDADENLAKEGIETEKITRVGNIMLDTYEFMSDRISRSSMRNELGLEEGKYGVVTLHRPSNVDQPEMLEKLLLGMRHVSRRIKLVFPVHPRTRRNMERFGFWHLFGSTSDVQLTDPLGYIDFMNLVCGSRFVVTDSGGIQEETTYLGIPCLTLRRTTERPITVTLGTNRLVDVQNLTSIVDDVLNGKSPQGRKPLLWDGATAARVVHDIVRRTGCVNAPSGSLQHKGGLDRQTVAQ